MCIVWYGHNYAKYQKECGIYVLSTCVTLFIYMWMLKYLSCNWKLLCNICYFMKNVQEVKATVLQKYRRISVFKMRVIITHLAKEKKIFSNIPFPWQHIVKETFSPSIKKKVLYLNHTHAFLFKITIFIWYYAWAEWFLNWVLNILPEILQIGQFP